MAVSGNQKTRIGGQLSGVGIKQTFTAKAAGEFTLSVLDFGRGFMRGMFRGITR